MFKWTPIQYFRLPHHFIGNPLGMVGMSRNPCEFLDIPGGFLRNPPGMVGMTRNPCRMNERTSNVFCTMISKRVQRQGLNPWPLYLQSHDAK